jgi:Mor family transcriptional regulator
VARPRSPAVTTRDAEIYSRWNAGERHLATLAKDYEITPQRVGQVIAAKDAQVYAAWRTGKHTLGDLADIYELTAEDVTRIITARHPEPKDEENGRAVLRSRIELLMVAIQEVIENPGFKLAPNGRLAEGEDGKPLVDIGARIEAMKLQLSAYERASRLEGADKQQLRKMDTPTANEAMWAALASVKAQKEISDAERRELEELRQRVGNVLPGEVVRELPPGTTS